MDDGDEEGGGEARRRNAERMGRRLAGFSILPFSTLILNT